MTGSPWPPEKPWEIHIVSGRWPTSSSGAFLAEAARKVGNATFIEWNDETLSWLYRPDWPFIPEAKHVFTDKGTNQRLYDLYANAVREVCSAGFFQFMELHKAPMEEWLASMVPDPDGGEPMPLPQLRYQRGEDRDDPITEAHWNSAWWQAAMKQDEVEGARRYLPAVASTILKAAQGGSLKTYARPFHGGPSTTLDPVAWEVDNAMDRLSWCALDPERPHDPEAAPTHWIFVGRDSLASLIAGIDPTSLLPELQPPPAALLAATERERDGTSNVIPLPSKAAALTECTVWLVARFDDPETERMVKDQFKEEAMQRWHGRLSARGFVTAWSNAVAARPERAKPGRRP